MLTTIIRFALVVVVLCGSTVAQSQEPKPVELLRAALEEGEPIELTLAWRFRTGDDPRWADPRFDDSRWEIVDPLLPPVATPAGGWTGIGWFRRHLRLEPALVGKTLVVRVRAPGDVRLFVDGEPLLSSAGLASDSAAAPGRGAFGVVTFSPEVEHVLAVRYELSRDQLRGPAIGPPGFRLSIEDPGAVEKWIVAEAIFLAIATILTLLHLALFWSYRKARENLYYAAAMVAFAGIVICDEQFSRVESSALREMAQRAITPFILATIFFVLLTYLSVRLGRLPRSWVGFAVAGAGLAAWTWADPESFVREWAWYLFFVAMGIEIVRVETRARKVRREGVGVLLVGLSILGTIIFLQILINLGALSPIAGITDIYVFGMLAFAVAMSLFLAGTFARTSVHLERKLDEVRTLSEQVLAQERVAHEQELRRRLLEAEDARKSEEIAAARALQLAMLPRSLPELPGLETAAVMTTATEVGGDYYDFKVTGDGGLIVALGDATGHGVAAGTVVTAVKAVFSVLGAEASLAEMLAECDRALRGLNVHPLHMCLILARVTPWEATVCSAAMPPVLLFRAATTQVEELGAGGLPLGARLGATWQEHRAPLAPGDTLLFATDGLAELRDPNGAELGFAGAAGALSEAGGGPAREVLDRLSERAAAWCGERPLADDLTMVAVRVLTESP